MSSRTRKPIRPRCGRCVAARTLEFTRWRESARIEIGGAARAGDKLYSMGEHGAGFDSRRAERLLRIFQGHPATEFEGTDMGLSIARRIIERHGGRMWAQSEPDRGAALHFTLP